MNSTVTTKAPGRNRWSVVLGAVLIQLSLGVIYAWSVFTPVLRAAGWSKLDTQVVFSVGLVTFAVVMVFAGRLLGRYGPRRLAVVSGLTLGAGYAVAGWSGGAGFWPVCIGVGVIGGAGIGLGYVVPIAVGMRWFPDRKGLITGLAVAGFGFGAMGWIKAAGEWGLLLERYGLAETFLVYGASLSALVLVGSFWMVMPPKGWSPAGYRAEGRQAEAREEEYSRAEMFRTPQFHLICLTFAVSAGAGLMSIGLMKLYPMEALQSSGYSLAEASAIAGTAMAVFFSLFNGIGRIVWGMLSDRIGRKRSVILMTGSQGVVLFLFSGMATQEYLLYLGAALIGFNFGGNFALFPALTADVFGTKRVGENYPLVFLSYGVGGLLGPILGGMLGDLGNFPLAFSICAAACLLGALSIAMVLRPDHDEAVRPFTFHGALHQLHLDHLEEVVDHALHPEHYRRVDK